MKIAIVTGASSGMGREFVKQIELLYKDLDEIWVVARRTGRLKELKANTYTYIRIFDGDLTKDLVYKQVKNRLENQNPDIRMLVNAAGFGKSGTIEAIAEEDAGLQLAMIDVNCRALTQMTTVCLPYMSKGSRIVNMASAAAFCPQPSFAVYAATKSYVLSFSRALGTELQERQIYVTAVCPGPVDTEFLEKAGKPESKFKDSFLVKPKEVVKQALIDAKHGKEVSVYGTSVKGAQIASKVLPHGMILEAMKNVW